MLTVLTYLRLKRPAEASTKTARAVTADRAVSPVIGVILMVAITVMLAAVIGTFVFGLAPGGESTPSVQLTVTNDDGNDDTVQLRHDGGPSIDMNEFTLLIDGTTENRSMTRRSFAAGEQYTVELNTEQLETGEVVVRHDPSDSIVARETVAFG